MSRKWRNVKREKKIATQKSTKNLTTKTTAVAATVAIALKTRNFSNKSII